MSQTRLAAVAGTFYPADPDQLQGMVDQFLEQATPPLSEVSALIAPHAGYIYSGPIAASAYVHLKGHGHKFKRVILLGPAHREHVKGIAASTATKFATPLGDISIDKAAIDNLVESGMVHFNDSAHALEHSLEVQLPFLQRVLDEFELVPLLVGEASPLDVEILIEHVWDSTQTLMVISSDLSHFLDYESARQMDESTSKAIAELNPEHISRENACGGIPVKGMLYAARQLGLRATAVDLRNSGDTAGDKNRVVGYGAYIFN